MEYTIISRKAFLIVCGLGILYLIITYLFSSFRSFNKVVLCNEDRKLSIYLVVREDIDILIKPGKTKDVLSCLGKHMAFYDRTLDYIIQPQSTFDLEELQKRYTIGSISYSPNYQIDSIEFKILQNSAILINTSNQRVVIRQKESEIYKFVPIVAHYEVTSMYMPLLEDENKDMLKSFENRAKIAFIDDGETLVVPL